MKSPVLLCKHTGSLFPCYRSLPKRLWTSYLLSASSSVNGCGDNGGHLVRTKYKLCEALAQCSFSTGVIFHFGESKAMEQLLGSLPVVSDGTSVFPLPLAWAAGRKPCPPCCSPQLPACISWKTPWKPSLQLSKFRTPLHLDLTMTLSIPLGAPHRLLPIKGRQSSWRSRQAEPTSDPILP